MLLHFTQELSTLESIFKLSFFKLGYCAEYFGKKDKVISSAAHPMVSFSEYEDTELKHKEITYGGYAVGLSKEWAISKGLSPVLYVEKNSQAAIGISALLKARQKRGKDAIPTNLRLPIMQVKCFTKHETGYNSHLNDNLFCFKDENEWRYVPTKKQIGGHYISLHKRTFMKNKEKYNNRLLPYPLKFTESDIVAIYVKNETEKLKLITQFPYLKGKINLSQWKTA